MEVSIKSELRKVVKHVPVYTLGSILSQFVGFLLIPVYTRFLSPSDYGTLQLVVLTGDILSIVAGVKVGEAVLRFYFEPQEKVERNLIMSTSLITCALLAAIFVAPFIATGDYLAKFILGDPQQGYLIQLTLVNLVLNLLFSLVLGYIQIREKSKLFLIASLGKLLLNVSLNIYFVTVANMGVFGVVLGTLISTAVFSTVGIPFTFRIVGFSWSAKWAKRLLRYGLPFIPSTLANRVAHSSDRYFLRNYLSLADVGVYSLAYRLGGVVHNIFNVSLFRLLNVRIFAFHKEKNAPQLIASLATYSFIFLTCVGLCISLFSYDLIVVMTPEPYWQTAKIIPPVVVCYIIFASESFIVLPILFSGKTERLSYVNISVGAVNIGLNFWLIPAYGINGAIVATFISFLLKIVGIYWMGRRLYTIPYEWRRMGASGAIALIIFFLGFFLDESSWLLRLPCNMLLVVSFIGLLWFTGVIRKDEKANVLLFIRQKFPVLLKSGFSG